MVRKEYPGLLNDLPGDKKKQLLEVLSVGADLPIERGVMVSQTHVTAGPVPPAELLHGYNDAFPDGGLRLFNLVEAQSQHRQELEKEVIRSQIRVTHRGQWIAAGVAILFGAGESTLRCTTTIGLPE